MAGCASTPKVDWDSRVGIFTYDQVVAEMGPPDKSSKLSDGSTVAEWFVKKNSNVSFGVGTGFYNPDGLLDHDFHVGPIRPASSPYNPDGGVNLGPRFGFSYSPGSTSKTVANS